MARVKETVLTCDKCGAAISPDEAFALVTVDVHDGLYFRLDLCEEHTTELPEGTERKRPAPRKKA